MKEVLQRLLDNCLYVVAKKSELVLIDLSNLGQIISVEGICLDLLKVSKVRESKLPQIAYEIRSFLALGPAFSSHIKNFLTLLHL